MSDLSDFNDEWGLTVPKEKHFLDMMMACLKPPHGFTLMLASPKPSPHDGRACVYLNGTDGAGTMYTVPVYFRLPMDLTREHTRRPTVEFMEGLQRGIDAKAEEGRKRMCRHYARHAESRKSGNNP